MKEKEYKIAKEKYVQIKQMLENVPQLTDRLEKLEEDPKVKEYIGLSKILMDVNNGEYTAEKMVDLSFGQAALNTNHSNKIFVYMGSYDLVGTRISYYSPFVEYDLYCDLETKTEVYINFDEREEFQKENNVIYLRSKFSDISLEEYADIFEKVRNEFLDSLVNLPQETAVNSFVKKYNRK